MENVLGRHLECQPLDLTLILFGIQISSGYVWALIYLQLYILH